MIQPRRDHQSLLEVAHNLEFLTGIGYRIGSHLSGATSDRVRFHADSWKIESCQGCTTFLNSSGGVSAESIHQVGDYSIVAGCRFQQK